MKPSVKRSIAHNMALRHKLQDVAGYWGNLVDTAVVGKIATEVNCVEVNLALKLQTEKLQQIAAAVDNE